MDKVTITGFTPTFDFAHFEAKHHIFVEKVMRGEMSLDDITAACASEYDPTTVYNTLQPLIAVRVEDRKRVSLVIGTSLAGISLGFGAPYFLTVDPSATSVCCSGTAGVIVGGLIALLLTYTPRENTTEQEYDLAYDHIGAVIAALEKEHDFHRPLAEQLVSWSGDGYMVFQSRQVEQGSFKRKVENRVRYSLQSSEYILDLLVVNGVPNSLRIFEQKKDKWNNTHSIQIREYSAKTPPVFTFENPALSFPQRVVDNYQAAIVPYGKLTLG